MRFVDTSFWIALFVLRDRNFQAARKIWRDGRSRLMTSNHVVGETWTALRRRVGYHGARRFLDSTEVSTRVTIHHADESIEAEAWQWLRRHDEREYSFVDATSFALMRRHRIIEVLAFDGGFSAAGFIEVRP